MKNDKETTLLDQAKEQMIADMKQRGIGAIIWNVAEAGFHYIPEIMTGDGPKDVVRVTGLYQYEGKLYAIEEGLAHVDMKNFYTEGVDVPPTVVTLTEGKASEVLGSPDEEKGYTTDGTVQEWVTIADCYFEALNI